MVVLPKEAKIAVQAASSAAKDTNGYDRDASTGFSGKKGAEK
jgi:hypothetical protein